MSSVDTVMLRMIAMFGEPKTEFPDVFLADYCKALEGWNPEVLDKATDRVQQTCVFWPKPAEFLEQARAVASEIERAKPRRPAEHEDIRIIKRSPDEIAMAQELVDNFARFVADNTVSAPVAKTDWKRGQRDGFEAMQRNSPNRGMHMTSAGLSNLSKRMSGDAE